jgi:hypothetical protein
VELSIAKVISLAPAVIASVSADTDFTVPFAVIDFGLL